jgi:hypothetical protein
VAIGGGAALLSIAVVGLLTFKFGMKLPYRKLLVLTGFLVVTIMVSFIGQTVRLFQTVGWLSVHPIPNVHIPDWAGLWLGLYPSWEGLFIPPLALVYVGGAWLITRWRSSAGKRELALVYLESKRPERVQRCGGHRNSDGGYFLTGLIIMADAGTTGRGTNAITEEVTITDAITTPVITLGTTLSSEGFRFRSFPLFPLFHSPAFN